MGFNLSSQMREYYIYSLSKLNHLLDEKIKFTLFEMNIIKRSLQQQLEKQWDDGNRDLSDSVINGILNNELLDFKYIK